MSQKRQSFANLSLTRNTISDCISDFTADIHCQLKENVSSFVAFSVAFDENTIIAKFAVFIRGVD